MIDKIKKYFKNTFKEERYEIRDLYIVTADLEQKEWKEVGGVKLKMVNAFNRDNRQTRPTIGKILWASEGSQFKVGDEIICRHFTFEDSDGNRQHFIEDPVYGKLFMVNNYNLMFAIDDSGELIPREGVLLCKPVYGKFKHTDLEVAPEYEGRRRDIAEIVKVWDGCKTYKVGQYVMLKLGGDYEFEHNGQKYIRVDTYNEDDYAIVDSPDWYDGVLRKHETRNLSTDDIYKKRR